MRLEKMALAAACFATMVAIGCTDARTTPEDERGDLGKACSSDSDCGGDLYCEMGDPIFGLCTESCSDTDECQLRYGLGSFCIGANVCVRECVQEDDCLAATACDSEFSWCR